MNGTCEYESKPPTDAGGWELEVIAIRMEADGESGAVLTRTELADIHFEAMLDVEDTRTRGDVLYWTVSSELKRVRLKEPE